MCGGARACAGCWRVADVSGLRAARGLRSLDLSGCWQLQSAEVRGAACLPAVPRPLRWRPNAA